MNYNDLKRILVKIKSLSHLETAYMISSKKMNKVLENEYHDGNINIDELTDLQVKLNEILSKFINEDSDDIHNAYVKVCAHQNAGSPLFYGRSGFSDLIKLRKLCDRFLGIVNRDNYESLVTKQITKTALDVLYNNCVTLDESNRDSFYYNLRNLERVLICCVTRFVDDWEIDFTPMIETFYEKEKANIESVYKIFGETVKSSNSFSDKKEDNWDILIETELIVLELKKAYLLDYRKAQLEVKKQIGYIDSLDIKESTKYDLKDYVRGFLSNYGVYSTEGILMSARDGDIVTMIVYSKTNLEKAINFCYYIVANTSLEILLPYCEREADGAIHSKDFQNYTDKDELYLSLMQGFMNILRVNGVISMDKETEIMTREKLQINEFLHGGGE